MNKSIFTEKQMKEFEETIDSFVKKAKDAGITTKEIRTVMDTQWILALTKPVETQDWYQDIKDFHKTFGHHIEEKPNIPPPDVRRLRLRLIQEETSELLEGIKNDDLVAIADGGVDAIVVILGTMISYGIPFQAVWGAVHRSNMAKVGGGKDAEGKSLKPPGWQPPQIKEILDSCIV